VMRFWVHGRGALSVSVATVFLAGCGGAQTGIPLSGSTQSATSLSRQSGKSWMKRDASHGDLLYVSSIWTNDVYVYSYPKGSLVGTLTGFQNVSDLCSDSSGDVFVTNGYGEYSGGGYLLEYAHGGTSPIATFRESQYVPQDCAVDPTTGNIAVANHDKDFAVFIGGSASPTYYSTAGILPRVSFATYDNSGNAYFSGDHAHHAAWLPKRASAPKPFKLREPPQGKQGYHDPGFGWDGTYLTDMSGCGSELARFKPHGRIGGKLYDAVFLKNTGGCFPNRYAFRPSGGATSRSLVVVGFFEDEILFYDYPKGGNPTKTIKGLGSEGYGSVLGVTISVAPSVSHSRK
jgi:hypothetical protein